MSTALIAGAVILTMLALALARDMRRNHRVLHAREPAPIRRGAPPAHPRERRLR